MNAKLITSSYSVIVFFIIYYYVNVYLCGNYFWTFWPADYWGIPNIYSNLNFTPILAGDERGWDGQFYYYISNDLFGLGDTYLHVDAPSYRWQRVGLPIFAKLVSLLMFSNIVLPIHYILANIFIVSFGLYVLMQYYKELGLNPLISLFWGFSLGTLITLTNGLPDASADALFLIAFISYLRNKKIMYLIFMCLTVLTREGYVVAAFIIFCVELFNVFKEYYQKENFFSKYVLGKVVLFSLPGIIFLLWQIYITQHFSVLPSSQAYGILNIPFMSLYKSLLRLLEIGDMTALLGLYIFFIITSITIILSFIKMFGNRKYSPIFFLGILIFSLGDTVMLYYRDFLKAITVFIALIPILVIGFDKKVKYFAYISLMISLIFSIVQYSTVRGTGFAPINFNNITLNSANNSVKLTQFNSQLNIINSSSNKYLKFFLNVDREIFTIEIKNNSNQIFFSQSNSDGNYATMLTYHFFKKNDLSKPIGGDYRSKLSHNIMPGETSIEKMIIYYPKEKGIYIIRITLLQHPVAFFYNVGGGYQDIEIEVK